MAGDLGTKVVITVQYTLDAGSAKSAGLLADLAKQHGTNFGSDNYTLWDFNPEEEVIETTTL